MGLRVASVRRSNASVMAPALTEANQSQNFKLSKNPRLQSVSPVNGHSHNGGCSPRVEEHFVCKELQPMVTKSHPESNNHDICDALDNLNTLAFVSEIVKVNGHVQQASASETTPLSKEVFNMNNCPPMGEQPDTMGLQKSGDMSHKDKNAVSNTTDMEQLLRTVMQGGDLGSVNDLASNVDDFMQVLKTIEATGPQQADGVGESEVVFPITGLSSFCQNLLNDVDVLNMVEEPVEEQSVDQDDTLVSSKEIVTQGKLVELRKEQVKLERRYEFLLRRLRKIQTRGMLSHVSAEVAGLFEHTHRMLKRVKDKPSLPEELTVVVAGQATTVPVMETAGSALDAGAATQWPPDVKKTLPPPPEKIKGLSASSLKYLVHKLEKTKLIQSNALNRTKLGNRYFGAGSIDPAPLNLNSCRNSCVAVPPLTLEARQELERVAGMLETEIGVVQHQVDSDATASSSGAESCDEMQTFNNAHQQYCTIGKRASWKWAQDRAALATRWTWLQWQISDLEYRIRQMNELHKKIRNSKGAVVFGSVSKNPTCTTTSPGSVNGYRGILPGQTKTTNLEDVWLPNGNLPSASAGSSSNQTNSFCSRTRPFVKSVFRNRRLLQTTGLHAISKKWRSATMRCNCVPGIPPCALCTGRADPIHPKESSDLTTVQEQIAYLDAGLHPKISFPEDVNQSFHYDALLKMPEWQQKTARSMTKALKLAVKPERTDKSDMRAERRLKKPEHRRKYNKLVKASTASALSAKIKNRLARGRKPNRKTQAALIARLNRKRPAEVALAQLQALSGNDLDANELDDADGAGASGMIHPSPVASPPLLGSDRVGFNREYRRNRIDSYDIDNIVIPYSVAASTRVEKLPYKEILTPKWRVIDSEIPPSECKNNGMQKNENHENEEEDISDEIILVRHEKCELEERRKFMSYIKFPLTGSRSRANRRTDSRAESSGANTPDPMSPHTGELLEASNSPLTSPPATPLAPISVDELIINNSISTLRRRTASQSRWAKEREVVLKDDTRCTTPDHVDVLPYDNRNFPISDDVYDVMLGAMPAGHPMRTELKCDAEFLPPLSMDSESSTESILGEEDPNDPEWMVVERIRDRPKR